MPSLHSWTNLLPVEGILGLLVVGFDAPDEVWAAVDHLLQQVHEGVSEVGAHGLLRLGLGGKASAVELLALDGEGRTQYSLGEDK